MKALKVIEGKLMESYIFIFYGEAYILDFERKNISKVMWVLLAAVHLASNTL